MRAGPLPALLLSKSLPQKSMQRMIRALEAVGMATGDAYLCVRLRTVKNEKWV